MKTFLLLASLWAAEDFSDIGMVDKINSIKVETQYPDLCDRTKNYEIMDYLARYELEYGDFPKRVMVFSSEECNKANETDITDAFLEFLKNKLKETKQ